VDTDVILDVLNDDPRFASASIVRCGRRSGALMACDVVWGEVGAWYARPEDAAYAWIGLGSASPRSIRRLRPSRARVAVLSSRAGDTRERMSQTSSSERTRRCDATGFLTRDRGSTGRVSSV
jgi:hypothetical protein